MTPAELLSEFRRTTFDNVAPYLWSNSEVYGYIDQAHVEFARLGLGGIRDSRSELTTVTASAGEDFLVLSPKILKLVSARRADSDEPVDVVGAGHPDALRKRGTGRLYALVTGEDDGGVRPVNVPDEDVELRLHVRRLPLAKITDGASVFEIPEEHHRSLLWAAMSMAYSKQDGDGEAQDDAMAKDCWQQFLNKCSEAFLENQRRGGSRRCVAYGGI